MPASLYRVRQAKTSNEEAQVSKDAEGQHLQLTLCAVLYVVIILGEITWRGKIIDPNLRFRFRIGNTGQQDSFHAVECT